MSGALPSVSITAVRGHYPRAFPFHPGEHYPEYPGPVEEREPNAVYAAVRKSLFQLGYDRANFGRPEWNPLGCLVRPGERVFIKPNLVTHEYGRKNSPATGDLFAVITHPSVVRAVADYAAIALHGRGELIIGDNPSIDANFPLLMQVTGLDRLPPFYRDYFGLRCQVLDLREQWCDDLQYYSYRSKMKRLPGDPAGETVVNLGKDSLFYGMNPLLFRGVFTNRRETIRHHHAQHHEYSVSSSIYNADVYISVPKLKTHHKVGATLNIKGLVGICAKKNYLIHWRIGPPGWGGDEYPGARRWTDDARLFLRHLALAIMPEELSWRLARRLKGTPLDRIFHVASYRGAWQGNDTCWRMAADLYKALLTRPRKYFSVIDGVTGGEGNGPFCPRAKDAGVIVAGDDLVVADCAAVRIMDLDRRAIRYLTYLIEDQHIDLGRVRVVSRDFEVDDFFQNRSRRYFAFQPPLNWPDLSMRDISDEDHHSRRRKGRAAPAADAEHAEAAVGHG